MSFGTLNQVEVTLATHNLLGQRVGTLFDGIVEKGKTTAIVAELQLAFYIQVHRVSST